MFMINRFTLLQALFDTGHFHVQKTPSGTCKGKDKIPQQQGKKRKSQKDKIQIYCQIN
ncbi:hypothetical protein [Alkanindiges hydrocarboniclasticus]|uniref:hypothetical protein n=1 Tax=Alkanindiges hydrocarboniclasticus TaxID=1907941 RepID=UPI001300E73D|nr:hypothetical protein [Alkanindiges hydrocarboniclasticus]